MFTNALRSGSELSDDGNYLIVYVDKGCDPHNTLYYVDLKAIDYHMKETPKLMPIVDQFEAKYDYVDNDGTTFMFRTNHDASMFKLTSVELSKVMDKVPHF